MNNYMLLVSGGSTTGKSHSLKNLKTPKGVVYLNTENNKSLPFVSEFNSKRIICPIALRSIIQHVAKSPDKYHTIVLDSMNYLSDLLEDTIVDNEEDTRRGWKMYGAYLRALLQKDLGNCPQRIIVTGISSVAEDVETRNEQRKIVLKGAINKKGIESGFNNIVESRIMEIDEIEETNGNWDSPLISVSKREEKLGFKNVFQVMKTKETINSFIRSAENLWEDNETFIDNDCEMVMKRLQEFYESPKPTKKSKA